MKKVVLGLFALILLGAGCMPSASVEGDWFLAFDLPNDWVMVHQYQMDSEVIPLDEGVSTEMKDIVLQSTPKNVYTSSGGVPETEAFMALGDVEMHDFTYIRVLKLDTRRVVPSEAEDLGNGFYKEDTCVDIVECGLGGAAQYQYYFVTEDSKYQFIITLAGRDISDAEGVILTAREVTIAE